MPKRLLSLLLALMTIAIAPAVASAQSVSLHADQSSSAAVSFDSQDLLLGRVSSAQLIVGGRRMHLSSAELRRARRARRIVVEDLRASRRARASARLILTAPRGSLDAAAARAEREMVRLRIAAEQRRRRTTSSGTQGTSASTGSTQASSTSAPTTSSASGTAPTASSGAPASSTASSANGPAIGINVGSAIAWELQFAHTLGAKSVRMNFPIDTPTSQMDSIIAAYAQDGIRADLLATFDGSIPTAADDANLAAWAQRYGPGGSFWAGSGYPSSLAVTDIEFGNESGDNYEYPQLANNPNWWGTSTYASIAAQYGQAYVQAVNDINAVNPGVKLLAVADSSGDVPEWLANMFQGAPTLKNVVEGWILHPYGSGWQSDIQTTLAQTQSLGASSSVPVYITEVGVATDNGNCLDDNYGWNPCLTYSQAASTLTGQVQGIKSLLGSRLAQLDVYSARDIDATGTSNDREGYFGALQSNGQSKGAFTTAIENLLASSAS